MISTELFTWLQGATFYLGLHEKAVETLPRGESKTWIDVGCGPGLVARLAASRGYDTTGIDIDPSMILEANRIARREKSMAQFYVGSIANLPTEPVDVVSAASLLAVLGNREEGLRTLWKSTRVGGTLLIIEPTEQMTTKNANKLIRERSIPSHRSVGLRLWAFARQNNIVNPDVYQTLEAKSVQFVPLLDGLVGAWIIKKHEK